jgi:hypothetical protein
MLTCGFASHRASCTVAQHSNNTINVRAKVHGVGAVGGGFDTVDRERARLNPTSRAQPESPSVYRGDIMSSAGDLLVAFG